MGRKHEPKKLTESDLDFRMLELARNILQQADYEHIANELVKVDDLKNTLARLSREDINMLVATIGTEIALDLSHRIFSLNIGTVVRETELSPIRGRGDQAEVLLQQAGANREEYISSRLILSAPVMPQFRRGDMVQVRIEDGSWRVGLRAISGVEYEDSQPVVWVCWEDEWQSALQEGREPEGMPWPYEQVEFWDGGPTLDDAPGSET
jgi:hypothetical protein